MSVLLFFSVQDLSAHVGLRKPARVEQSKTLYLVQTCLYIWSKSCLCICQNLRKLLGDCKTAILGKLHFDVIQSVVCLQEDNITH